MAQKASEYTRLAGSDFLIGSSNFWVPPYRSRPHPPTELEQLAVRMGIGDEDFRQLLHDEIERRRAATPPDLPESNGDQVVSDVDPFR